MATRRSTGRKSAAKPKRKPAKKKTQAKKKAPAKKKASSKAGTVMKDAQRMIRTGETKSMSVAMKRAWKKVK